MDVAKYIDVLCSIGIQKLEESPAVLDAEQISREIKKIVGIVGQGDRAENGADRNAITDLVDRLELDKEVVYRAGFEAGIRLCRWISTI